MRYLTHGLLAVLLVLAPLQASHAFACDQARADAAVIAEAGRAAAVSAGETCDEQECSCVCGVSCLHQCASCAGVQGALSGLFKYERAAGAWAPAASPFYLDFILPTDTRPPKIPA